MTRQLAALRKQLTRPGDGPLEEMAIHRIVASWLNIQTVDFMCAQADGELEKAKLWLKRQEQAQKMFNSTLKGLVLIRQYLSPDAPPAKELPTKPKPRKTGGAKAKKAAAAVDSPEKKNGQAKHAGLNGKTKNEMSSACGVNRVAGLTGGKTKNDTAASANGKSNHVNRLNGHDPSDLLETMLAGSED
jgi:hypothetical protein